MIAKGRELWREEEGRGESCGVRNERGVWHEEEEGSDESCVFASRRWLCREEEEDGERCVFRSGAGCVVMRRCVIAGGRGLCGRMENHDRWFGIRNERGFLP